MDGRGVVTPRDVIELVTRAKQYQHDAFEAEPAGESEVIIDKAALKYGLDELSKKKRDTLLKAEFPHFWPDIELFVGGKSEFSEAALAELLGAEWQRRTEDLVAIGFLRKGAKSWVVPPIFRHGLSITQGRASPR